VRAACAASGKVAAVAPAREGASASASVIDAASSVDACRARVRGAVYAEQP
jgi:hypothetical protein